jgi:DNA mismatch repair protein MutL
MTHKISILPNSVAEKIAAGEVVPRPAAAVKELLDNALDSGAGRVEVDVYKGGIEKIVVIDDGCGMSRQDLEICVLRHATSKIKTLEDLNKLVTLGFRGEALAAISSVSQIEILTREADSDTGYRLRSSGGEKPTIEAAGCPVGTRVSIANLFYNVPVRRKFLKTVPTEFRHISDAFTRVALAAEGVHLVLRHNDRQVLQLPRAEDRLQRLLSLWGRELEQELIPVLAERDGIAVSGYVSRPSVSRKNTSQLFILANDRVVNNRNLISAVLEGYRHMLERGRYPVGALYLDIDPEMMDINVHPSKLEVRFSHEGAVFGAIVRALRNALEMSLGQSPGIAPARLQEDEQTVPSTESPKESFMDGVREAVSRYLARPQSERKPYLDNVKSHMPPKAESFRLEPKIAAPAQIEQEIPAPTLLDTAPHEVKQETPDADNIPVAFIRPLTRLFGLFIVAETDEGLVIMDAHAAHERVNYEVFRRRLDRGGGGAQRLLFPLQVQLASGEAEQLEEHSAFFNKLGFKLQPFGPDSFALESLPPRVRMEGADQLIRDILSDLVRTGEAISWDERQQKALITLACHASTRANDALDEADMAELLDQWMRTPNREVCPHGRPISVRFSESDLYKLFKRS